MPRVPRYKPQVAPPQEKSISGIQRLLAGGTRMASGVLSSEGLWPGALTAAAGEGIAEMIEDPTQAPSLTRMGVEGTIGAIPFGKVIKYGKPWVSSARSGLLSGVGEAGREVARGEELQPKTILTTAGIGALLGNVFGRFGGGKAQVEPKAEPILDARGKPPIDTRETGYVNRYPVQPRGTPAQQTSELTRDQQNLVRTEKWAQKETQRKNAAAQIAERRATLQPQEPTITDTIKADLPETGGTESSSQKWTPPKPEKGEGGGGSRGSRVRPGDVIDYEAQGVRPSPDSPPRQAESDFSDIESAANAPIPAPAQTGEEIYQGWLKTHGLPDNPNVRAQFPWRLVGGETTVPRPQAPARVPAKPVEPDFGDIEAAAGAAIPEPPVQSPLGKLLTPKDITYENSRPATTKEPSELFKAQKARAQAAQDELEKQPYWIGAEEDRQIANAREDLLDAPPPRGVPEPPVVPAEPLPVVEEGLPLSQADELAVEPPVASQGGVPELARFFKSRVDAAGQGYRDIKAALAAGEQVPEAGRAAAGAALGREGRAAGLPPTPRGPRPPKAPPVEEPQTGREANDYAPPPATEEVPPTYDPNAPKLEGEALSDLFMSKGRWDLAGQQAMTSTPKGLAQSSKAREAALAARKAKKGGGGTSAGFLGITPDILGAIERNPEFAKRAGLTGVGALAGGVIGGATGHPFAGALAGAGAGMLGPEAISAGLKQLGMHPDEAEAAKEHLSTPEGITNVAHTFLRRLPQLQRFNLLADAWGLPANALVGPYGSATMAALEAHLSGDPRGMSLLRDLTPSKFLSEWNEIRKSGVADRLIQEGELGRMEGGLPGKGKFNELMRVPGSWMTSGDLTARKFLEKHGWSAEEARMITMTNEPELATTRAVANLSKKSPLLQMLQPFARTPSNIAEQGAYRIPGLGVLAQSFRGVDGNKGVPDTWWRQMVQQGLGLGVGGASYALGDNLSPEQARVVRRYVSNLGGQYSLPASIGFGMGQSHHTGNPALSAATVSQVGNSLPLPTTAPIREWANAALTPPSPNKKLPRGVAPTALLELLGVAQPQTPTTTLPRLRRMPRLGGR